MPLGRPAPCRANFFFDEISLKMDQAQSRGTARSQANSRDTSVDLERKMKVPKKREIIA